VERTSRSNTAITLRLLETFQHLLKRPLPASFKESVLHHAELVYLGSRDGLIDVWDRDEAKRHYDRFELKKVGGYE